METGCQGTGGREQELAASAVAEEAIQFRRVRDVAHASEVAEKGGTRLPYGRGSESARRVYSHLLSRDRQGAVVLVLFQQLKRAPSFHPVVPAGGLRYHMAYVQYGCEEEQAHSGCYAHRRHRRFGWRPGSSHIPV